MKFLADFVSCFSSIHPRSSTAEITASLPLPESGSSMEKPGSRTVTRNTRRKRGRSSGSAAGFGEWKPSLGSISEHNVVAVRRSVVEGVRAEVDQQGQRKVKRKSATSLSNPATANEVHHCGRSYTEDYGRGSISAVLPVFAPTPFVF